MTELFVKVFEIIIMGALLFTIESKFFTYKYSLELTVEYESVLMLASSKLSAISHASN